jgi:hypothetical protein
LLSVVDAVGQVEAVTARILDALSAMAPVAARSADEPAAAGDHDGRATRHGRGYRPDGGAVGAVGDRAAAALRSR